uniref:KASH domain-containing protein n=1 Tax=Cacopsylla melanoneura TaxID=428564 RepID=A0A8D9FB41_9HEMI
MSTPSMKNSFSLSSLPPSNHHVETPEQVRIRERPYNSLTKKPRKHEEKENWRKSWDSQSGKIGDGFQENYDYLMQTHLIDSCRSIATDGKIHANQTSKLVQLSPDLPHSLVDSNSSPNSNSKRSKPFHSNCLDLYLNIEHEIKGLISCMDCIETRLPPVNMRTRWKKNEISKEDLGRRKLKHEVIHQELEALGKAIRSKKNVLDSFSFTNGITNDRNGKIQSLNPTYKSIRTLEDRWQLLFLRSIEWECTIDQLLQKTCTGSYKRLKLLNRSGDQNTSSENTDEPASKCPRLSLPSSPTDRHAHHCSTGSEHLLMDTSVPPEDLRPSKTITLPNGTIPSLSQTSSNFSTTFSSPSKMVDLSCQLKSDSDNNNSEPKIIQGSDMSQFSYDESFFTKDASIFNNPARSAHNNAIIYHKHEDTDSEVDRQRRNSTQTLELCETNGTKNSESEMKTSDLSSEDDETSWAYDSTAGSTRERKTNPSESSIDNKTQTDFCQTPVTTKPCSKLPLSSKLPLDVTATSAIFSVENPKVKSIKKLVNYAELLVRRPSKVKRYHHSSSHSQDEKFMLADSCDASGEYTSEDELCDADSEDSTRRCDDVHSTPKVTLRAKSTRVDRPRSMSILPSSSLQHMFTSFSNSESALNQILNLSSHSVKTESSMNSSSTIEESSQFCDTKSHTSSLKRHRKKHRRLRKSGSGSADNLSLAKSIGRSQHHLNRTFVIAQQLYKSESFSGSSSRRLSFSGDKSGLSSDLRTLNNTTDAEIDELEEEAMVTDSDTVGEDKKKTKKKVCSTVPNFKIGKSTNFFPTAKLRTDFTSGAEEQTSSVGTIPDEAWDNYQEKYHSEAYSEELPDSELLHQTLHFGEDYGSFIDCQSDLIDEDESSVVESESEEDVEKFISKCKLKFELVEAIYENEMNMSRLKKTKLRRLVRDIIRKLRMISERLNDVAEIKDLMQKYENFENKLSSEESSTKDLKKEMDHLKREFTTLANRVTDIEDQKEIKEKIKEIQEKKDMLSRERNSFSQNEEHDRLYNELEESLKYCMKIADTLEQLEGDLISFQNDLKSEVDKLKNLELGKSAEFFEELIKHDLSLIQDPVALQDAKQLYQMTIPSCEGSDSGISDSEHDCERDKKLSDLRQLQKFLDSVLSSNKKTLIAKKMDETEAELRKLKNLRRLVFHSTLLPQMESEPNLDSGAPHDDTETNATANIAPWNICRSREARAKILAGVVASGAAVPTEAAGAVANDDPDKPEPPFKGNSHLWRIVRSALPFHLAIIVIACIVWMYQPSCCDQLNNLNLSRSPQLKYMSGSPPI